MRKLDLLRNLLCWKKSVPFAEKMLKRGAFPNKGNCARGASCKTIRLIDFRRFCQDLGLDANPHTPKSRWFASKPKDRHKRSKAIGGSFATGSRGLFFLLLFFSLSPLHPMAAKREPLEEHLTPPLGVQTFSLHDTARDRPVLVEVWYPIDPELQAPLDQTESVWVHPKEVRNAPLQNPGALHPLILMSHGHRGDRRERTWLVEALVQQGYIVAAAEHFGDTWHSFRPELSLRFWERAKDISFALDYLLQQSTMRSFLDPKRIGLVGYSMGGMTSLSLAGAIAKNAKEIALAQSASLKDLSKEELLKIDFSLAEKSYRDGRIRSVLLLCPATFVFPSESLSQVKIPIGLIAAIEDELLPHKEHAYRIIRHLVPQKLKLLRKEISHYAFLNRLSQKGQELLRKGNLQDPPCCHRDAVHQEAAAFAVEFFRETLDKK